VDVLCWRLAATDRRGVPYHDARRRSVVLGATDEIDDDTCVWFRVLPGGGGDTLSGEPAVAEARTVGRARERLETMTGLYRGKGWAVVDGPRVIDAPDPPTGDADIAAGYPLQGWAARVASQFAGTGP